MAPKPRQPAAAAAKSKAVAASDEAKPAATDPKLASSGEEQLPADAGKSGASGGNKKPADAGKPGASGEDEKPADAGKSGASGEDEKPADAGKSGLAAEAARSLAVDAAIWASGSKPADAGGMLQSCMAAGDDVVSADAEKQTKAEDLTPLVRRAAAFRIKYRTHDVRIRIPLEQVGFHPKNRDGQPPNGERCAKLCDDILALGFDAEEADSGGVLVQQKPGTSLISDFNMRACDRDEYLAPADAGAISYGSLSHSHLHQVLKNVKAGMKGAQCPLILDQNGKYSLEKLRSVDPGFAAAVDGGLRWEILSWRMEIEEPDACSIIQSALNAKHAVAMLAHEMQAFSKLCELASAAAENRLSADAERTSVSTVVERVQAALATTMPEFAADDNFCRCTSSSWISAARRGPSSTTC